MVAAEDRELKLDQTFVSGSGGTVETRILIVCDRMVGRRDRLGWDCKRVSQVYMISMICPLSPFPLSACSLQWPSE